MQARAVAAMSQGDSSGWNSFESRQGRQSEDAKIALGLGVRLGVPGGRKADLPVPGEQT
jgi:hypothetical protein